MMNRTSLAAGFAVGLLTVVALVVWRPGGRLPIEVVKSTSCEAQGKVVNLDFTLKNVSGDDVRLADFKGKVLVIDFWATWCGPCKIEVPGFVSLYDKYRPRGLEILGLVSLDEMTNVPAFVNEYNINYTILDANDRPDIDAAFGPIHGLPTTIVVGRDGRICSEHLGYTPLEVFEAEIRSLL